MFIRRQNPQTGPKTNYTVTDLNHEILAAVQGHDLRMVVRGDKGKRLYIFISKEELAKLIAEN